MKPLVLHHQRLSYPGQISIERLFAEIREFLPEHFGVVTATSPYYSKGFLPRLANLLFAGRQIADIHHVLGDVHYLCFGLKRINPVLTVHDCAGLERLPRCKRPIVPYFWFTGPMKRAAFVTAISQTTKGELQKWVGDLADKVVVIPNCIRSEFGATPQAFCKEAPVVLQVGTGLNKECHTGCGKFERNVLSS